MSEKEGLLKIIYPRIPPYKQVGQYLVSQQATKALTLPGYDFNTARTGPDSDLLIARRKYQKIVQQLNEKKESYKKKRVALDKQWDELEQLELKFKEQFQDLASFVVGNDDKRNRAIKRYAEDVKVIEQRDREIGNIKQKIEVLEEAKEEFDSEISAHKLYETYLNSVLGHSEEFKNAENILDRYESLVKTKIGLGLRQSNNFQLLEESRGKLNKMADEYNFKILGMNNILTVLQSRYRSASNASLHWEKIVYGIKNYANQRYKEVTAVKQGCRNTYLMMVKRKGETPKIDEDDFEEQLLYIKKTLKQLATITREAEKRSQKVFSSMKGEISKAS